MIADFDVNVSYRYAKIFTQQQFAIEGAKVAALGRNRAGLLDTSAHCFVVGDITEKGVCEEVVASSVDELGGNLILSFRACVDDASVCR